MRSNYFRSVVKTAALAMLLLSGAVASSAQTVALTASPQFAVLPDGNSVPMWGWTCGTSTGTATCAALNGSPQTGGTTWQPPLITVPTGSTLSITLTNQLLVPTSLVVVGQLGTGASTTGVGNPVRETTPRNHPPQTAATWPIQVPATFTPPAQARRAQSFTQEAAPLGTQTYTWGTLKAGTYLIETGTHPSIQGAMGLYGVLVVTNAPLVTGGILTPGCAYISAGTCIPSTQYDADVPVLLSEIDPRQNTAVDLVVKTATAGFETAKWNPTCGSAHSCYPPAVDYTPLYYLINGQSYDKNAPTASALPVPASTLTGNVLLRFVNAGLRMHVPSVVGLNMSLIAEDGNPLPEVTVALSAKVPGTILKVQNEVFLAAGKTEDVFVNPVVTPPTPPTPALYQAATYPIFDRQLSLSTNNQHDGGMQAILQVNGGNIVTATAVANADAYNYVPGVTLTVSDPGKGVVANDFNVYGVKVVALPTSGIVNLNPDGTFTYTPAGTAADSFSYCANGSTTICATVTLNVCTTSDCLGGNPIANADSYTSVVSSVLKVGAPGVLLNDSDPANHPLQAFFDSYAGSGCTVTLHPDGSFTAISTIAPAPNPNCIFKYHALNSQNSSSLSTTATVSFSQGNGPTVTVQDAVTKAAIGDYKWIIEQDLTFHVDPATQVNTGTLVPVLGTNFHTSYMPVVATGCTGPQSCERGQTVYDPTTQSHVPAACDGSGNCVPGATLPMSTPDQVTLSLTNPDGSPARYYISVLPGDAANPFNTGNVTTGHTIGGAPIAPGDKTVTVNVEPSPLPTATVTVYVFEDDYPLNGEPDAGGGVDSLANQEPSLEDFQVELWDAAGSSGDATGQMTYDMFNQPLSNSLNGTIDPATKLNACPISTSAAVGVIIVCPKYESDGKTLSPLTGQVVIKNLMPGRFGIIVHPGAAREARGEEWLQTNTLDGTHFQDSFIRAGEPSYFQEFGPGGYHVFMGMANPKIINARLADVCGGTGAPTCNNTVKGQVTNLHESRPPNESLSDSMVFPLGDARNNQTLGHTTCYASLGDPDGGTFAFTKCDQNGNFTFTGIPDGDWALVVFDQWLDLIVDGSSKSVSVKGGQTLNVDYSAFTWQTHIWSRTYMDLGGLGAPVLDSAGNLDPVSSPGLLQVPTRIRFRNGKFNNTLLSDIGGVTHFNETFPLFNWYVVESDTTRFKGTGVHVVYDSGGQNDGSTTYGGNGNGGSFQGVLNSQEKFPLPTNLRVPGAVYCDTADCTGLSIKNPSYSPGGSTGRIDPGTVLSEGLQGFLGQTAIIDWGKQLYVVGENGGIRGHAVYSSTRPFDDPTLLFQNLWEPLIPRVTINLYQEGTASDGTQSLTLIDTTTTSSWDDWAQGFKADGTPNMSCPGQDPNDPFFSYTLNGSKNYLNPNTALPNNSQYKCYDGMHAFNQVQPAPYDGMYQFPSPDYVNKHQLSQAQIGAGQTLVSLPPGKYVVEAITPPGYELVKEEDKNILIGDAFIAPVTQQFFNMVNIFIVPDQASMDAYNAAYGTGGGATNPTTNMGRNSLGGFGPGGLLTMPSPCAGALRVVPDFMSISPESGEVAPFAGASRHLCDRKEITLEDQMQAQTDFFMWTKTPAASHFAGFILDDFSSEFDPASPTFGEKFAVPTVPISIKDYNGVEVSRVYSDQWGIYNGLTYSTWQVNPPNPTGYAPNMMITCMNDPGSFHDPSGKTINDPFYNPAYSNFCYENPFMPADTDYLDTPVVPVSAFAEGYNPPDCAYPDATPSIASVISSDAPGPWVSPVTATHQPTLTITALGDQVVPNHAYSGPAASTAPYNQKTITRHYGFGGSQGTGTVTIGGVAAMVTAWSDTTITVNVPAGVPLCAVQQRGNGGAQCGELVITSGNGKQSIDTVTVTIGGIGGKLPTVVSSGQTIQSAIDAATPGDLIIVQPGTYNEFLLMWKPVRLQGVGAASVTVNANTHPAGKLDAWRRQVVCLFGMAINGGAISATNPYDPTKANPFTCSPLMLNKVDPIPLEAVIGWDATTNGNLAELLQEPTLMGAYEGAAITVLGKGMRNAAAVAGGAPAIPLTSSASDCSSNLSNFFCNPSRIDGMSFTNSSQGGGGIWAHGWNHNLEISNNRVFANGGTLTGGITIGQAEVTDGTISPNGATELPYLYNTNVNVHHNSVTMNASYGDELNSTTPASAGGVTFCSGSDYYNFKYNWVCGNLSSGDGGGFAHLGFSWNGDIEHNSFLFNQSFNPTITTYGGGVILQGAAPDGTLCENAPIDYDCPPQLPDGVGPNLVFNANLVIGNTAESGSGGGLRLQHVNGTDVQRSPNNPGNWHQVTVTNNIIANNVAGWTGGGVSLQDAVNVSLVNNTIVSNDTTASAGVLFDTLGAPNANVPPPGCDPVANTGCKTPITNSNFQPAGLEAAPHSLNLLSALTAASITCPPGTDPSNIHVCTKFSNPVLDNNLIWQNRAFHISVSTNTIQGLQNAVTLVPALSQTSTGACPAGAMYWDIGVYGDTAAGNHASGYQLNPLYSLLGDPGYDASNIVKTPNVVSQYCNGSRVPPEIAPLVCTSDSNAPGCKGGGAQGGITVPPGVPDINPFYPAFTLNPAATTDEGNNYINMFYGPLTLSNPTIASGGTGYGVSLGNYALAANSPAINAIPNNSPTFGLAPTLDFFGNKRRDPANPSTVDIGAVEFQGVGVASASLSPGSLTFGPQLVTTTSTAQTVTLTNTGNMTLTGLTYTFTGSFSRANAIQGGPGTCVGNLTAAAATCTINIVFNSTTPGAVAGTLAVASTQIPTPQTVSLSGSGIAPTAGASPNPLNFPNQPTNTTSSVQTVTVSNTGTAPLIITGVTITNPTAGAGFVVANACPIGGTSGLGVGATCNINVTFRPTSVGLKTGTLNVNVLTPGISPQVTLNGTGTAPVLLLAFSATPLQFHSPLNFTSASQPVIVTNTGNAPLTISSINFTGASAAQFAQVITPTCGTGTVLAANASCTINVTFAPTVASPTTKNASLNVNGASPAGSGTVSLSGTVDAPTYTLTGPPAFPLTQRGHTSTAQTITLANNSTLANLTINTVGKGGTNPGQFTIVTGPLTTCTNGKTIAAGATCTFSVTFTPSGSVLPPASTSRSATITVNPYAPGTFSSVAVSGTTF